MSAWIKLEKGLETDPRVLRAAKALARRAAELSPDAAGGSGNARALQYVTLLIGGLARLWIYADSHAREDDTLDLGFEELDELLGIPGFCSALPADWIVELDANRVELPGFQEHNGLDARRRALTSKRVERHRVTQAKRSSVTGGNAPALPDQTRPDQTRPKREVPPEPLASGGEPEPDRDAETVARVFRHWQSVHGHATARLDAKRRKLIRDALRSYPEEVLCESIAGYRNSPHHMGQNDRGTVYDSIELLLRDAKHIDAGLAFARNPPRTGLASISRRNVDATANWQPPELRRNEG